MLLNNGKRKSTQRTQLTGRMSQANKTLGVVVLVLTPRLNGGN